jgi:predicted GNAT family N-acyltransferase
LLLEESLREIIMPCDHRSELPVDQSVWIADSATNDQRYPGPWRLVLGDWSTLQASAAPIRLEVFVQEQHVPLEEEVDSLDPVCVHAVIFDEQGTALATGRLLPDGHIGRMAVLKTARARGIGSAVLNALVQRAQLEGFAEVVLSAQSHAKGFYLRHGFLPEGVEYLDANIPHILMRKLLPKA